ncbi:hypothetical protein ACPCDX_23490, partial [Streptomyces koyangensis]
MTAPTTTERRAMAARLQKSGALHTPAWRRAVESVPREAFLHPGVFLPEPRGRWRPLLADRMDEAVWARLAYSDQSLVTQLDGSLRSRISTDHGTCKSNRVPGRVIFQPCAHEGR